MKKNRPINAIIPGLGQRSIKTALTAALLALAYIPFGGNPTFACIGAIFGMGSDVEDSKRSGGNRFIGTFIGGILGLAMLKFEYLLFSNGNYYFKVLLIFIGIIILVWASVAFKWPGAVPPGGVIICIILFDTPSSYTVYALLRVIDTAIGVIVAIAVNYIFDRERVDALLRRNKKK